jgi:hypothetical protein
MLVILRRAGAECLGRAPALFASSIYGANEYTM